jgi:hypothetical protein
MGFSPYSLHSQNTLKNLAFNIMEIKITPLLEMNCFTLSHSRAEGGDNAGKNTWQASQAKAQEIKLLDTPEKLQAMRDFARSSGGWNESEVNAWNENEVNALFLQWIAGDCRELGADSLEDIDWQEAEELQSAGQAPSNLFRSDSGEIFFYLGY